MHRQYLHIFVGMNNKNVIFIKASWRGKKIKQTRTVIYIIFIFHQLEREFVPQTQYSASLRAAREMFLKWGQSGWFATCHNRLTQVWTVKRWRYTCFTRWEKNWKQFRIIFWGHRYTAILHKAFLQEPVLNQNYTFKNTIHNLPTQRNNIHNRTYFHFLKKLIVPLQYKPWGIKFEE